MLLEVNVSSRVAVSAKYLGAIDLFSTCLCLPWSTWVYFWIVLLAFYYDQEQIVTGKNCTIIKIMPNIISYQNLIDLFSNRDWIIDNGRSYDWLFERLTEVLLTSPAERSAC